MNKIQPKLLIIAFIFFAFARIASAQAIFVVNSTADTNDGTCTTAANGCTLREAINAANATTALDNIIFNIGTGTPTITLASELPHITAPVVIDGSTNGATRVEINGNNLNATGLNLLGASGGSTIRFLVVNRFAGSGIYLATNGNVVESNYVGTNADGTADLGNGQQGIFLSASRNNRIGGTVGTTPGTQCAGACNLVSGNNGTGIYLDSIGGNSSGNTIQGNFIGTNATGTSALSNSQNGVQLRNASNDNLVGGTTAAARNLISGNGGSGLLLNFGGISGNRIQGNFIGTNAAGSAKIANGDGVTLFGNANNNFVGGVEAGAGNVISGNNFTGVSLSSISSDSSSPYNNTVQGNFIGTDPTGALDLGNGRLNISVTAVGGVTIEQGGYGNRIGGTTAGAANVIAFNVGAGVRLNGPGKADAGVGNSILNNSIYSNNGLGITLNGGAGGVVTAPLANDAGDADTGANNRQNYPVISSAVTSSGTTIVQGTLNSQTVAAYRIQFFSNAACDSSGSGEGRNFLGELTGVAPNSVFTFNTVVPVSVGEIVTATATNQTTGDTSEFSACFTVSPTPDTTAPTVVSIDDGDADDTVNTGTTLVYTVTFNEDINAATVTAADFDNAGSSSITVGTISETSPGVFTVRVMPTSAGTLRLRIPSGAEIKDASGNALVVPVTDDTIVTVNAPQNLVVTKIADTNDGACSAQDCSLREAIAAASSGDTIQFSALFNQAQIITLADADGFRQLDINKSLTITGKGAQLLTVRRNAGNESPFRVFEVSGDITVNLSGMKIAGGDAGQDSGGGIRNSGGSRLTVADSHITGNNASFGGGIFNSNDGSVALFGTTISANTADCECGGGAGINNDGVLTIANSTVSGNVKTGGAGNGAGGIYNYIGTLTVTNSTVADNQTPTAGDAGGIFNYGGTVTVRNSIVAQNRNNSTVPDVAGDEFVSAGYNLVGNVGTATGFTVTGDQTGNSTTPLNPRISILGNFGGTPTHALFSNSPAVNAADPNNSPVYDQRGITRITGGRADIGAYELNFTFSNNPNGTGGSGTLPNGSTGQSYSVQISAARVDMVPSRSFKIEWLSNETKSFVAPLTYTIIAGSLPNGLTLAAASGTISGTPTQAGTFNFTVKAIDADGIGGAQTYALTVFGPTAAGVTIGGRILTPDGRGLTNARVVLIDSGGTRTAMSSSFGYYRFTDVAAGETVIITVASKHYTFAPQVVSVTEDLTELNFTAIQ